MMTLTAAYSYERQINYLTRGKVSRWQIVAGIVTIACSALAYGLLG